MKQTWRWFGPKDSVSVSHMLQAGVQGVVSALHHIPDDSVWSVAEIQKRQAEISRTDNGGESGLEWDVVESLPVSDAIKRQSDDWLVHVENYKQSLRHLASCGIKIVCYNFMPVLDWTRTDLAFELANGARCMRYDVVDFAAFDIHILKRTNAASDFTAQIVAEASTRFSSMDNTHQETLATNVMCGLPGTSQGYTLDKLQAQLALYDAISESTLRKHMIDFLAEVVPVAESLGVRLCCHPDDPPFPLLGLPRVMSTEEDYRFVTNTVNSPSNGITLCSGSLGVRADNDLPGMIERLGDKIHFVHLRNVERESTGEKISFHEASHLEGATDMVAVLRALLVEEQRRKAAGRADSVIPFRPDHGQQLISDIGYTGQPGYPAVGRLKGLAELRGIIAALSHSDSQALSA